MRPRLVLDTNVLISGLLFTGPPRMLLWLALEGTLELATSAVLVAEMERVLQAKFPGRWHAIQDTLQALTEIAIRTVPEETVTVILPDPSDDRVLECAISAHADVIVSGDKHLLALTAFRGIPILSPQTFLARWSQEHR